MNEQRERHRTAVEQKAEHYKKNGQLREGFFQFAQLNKVLPALPARAKMGEWDGITACFAMSKLIMQ